MIAQYYKLTLNFRFEAGTSRGTLRNKDSYFIKIAKSDNSEIFGMGEAGPLYGLSPDFGNLAELKMQWLVEKINTQEITDNNYHDFLKELIDFPSVKFALEMAMQQIVNQKAFLIYKNDFYEKSKPIQINGLVWMGTIDFMKKQINEKIKKGFRTIKLKVGAINFEDEVNLLKMIRNEYNLNEIELRLDANGAFNELEVVEKLKILSEFNIQSIEQPIKAGKIEAMAALCEKSSIPVALDEELILNSENKKDLLEAINPQYIVLKPSLIGGLASTKEWISIAESLKIGWWITSALESNIGLNAICQLCGEYNNSLAQGLGTGALFINNINSPLRVQNDMIRYEPKLNWDSKFFNQPN